jgi:hypothetical protein
MAGRPRMPTPIKRMKGTLRADRMHPREAQGVPGRPKMRKLPRAIRREWERYAGLLEELHVLTPGHGPALEAAAEATVTFWAVVAEMEAAGGPVKADKGLWQRYHDAWRENMAGLAHLGLTPVTMAKLHTVGVEAPVDQVRAFRDARPA